MGYKRIKTGSNSVSDEEASAIYDYIQTGVLPKKTEKKQTAKKSVKKDTVKKDTVKKTAVKKDDSKTAKKTKPIAKKSAPETDKKVEKKVESKISKPDNEILEAKPEISKPEIKAEPKKEEIEQKQEAEPKIEVMPEKKSKIKSAFARGETLASESLKKRRGLVIVKKKKDLQTTETQKN